MSDTKSKSMRILTWVIMNSIMAGCVYFGAYQDLKWAANVLYFLVILDFITKLGIIFNKKSVDIMKKKGRSVPKQIAYIFDIIIILALAGAGWFWMAGLWTFSASIEVAFFDMDEEEKP